MQKRAVGSNRYCLRWLQTIVPVAAQRKTSILAVSTALGMLLIILIIGVLTNENTLIGEDNFFSGLTQLRDLDTGELIFNVVRIGQICKKCRAGDASWLCTHKNYLLPAWKSSKKTARMKAVSFRARSSVRCSRSCAVLWRR